MGTPERKAAAKEEMRARIMNAALHLFLKDGVERVTMRSIAREIEYSPGTIYLYFKDKDEILHALHSKGFDELYKRQQALTSVKDPLARLRKHGEIYLLFAMGNPEYYDLMFIMRAPAKRIKEDEKWEAGLRSYEVLKQNVKECMDAELLPKADIDVAALTFWAHVHGMASLMIRDRHIVSQGKQITSMMRESIAFLIESIRKREQTA